MTTVIATRKAIYADSQCTSFPGFKTVKLAHVVCEKAQEDYLIGGAGYLEELNFLARLLGEYGISDIWKLHMTEHWPPKILKNADTDLLVVTRKKKIYMFNKALVPMAIEQDTYAIGSGAEYATSALAFGREPIGAIDFACEHDPYSKGPVHEVKFPKRKHAVS
jgi:ATP-dependent protease HslVU (ClpYQ) peptidase subunit